MQFAAHFAFVYAWMCCRERVWGFEGVQEIRFGCKLAKLCEARVGQWVSQVEKACGGLDTSEKHLAPNGGMI